MESAKRELVLSAARSFGPARFNALVRSATQPGRPQRFRYWEERFLPKLAQQAAVQALDFAEFIEMFRGVELMPEPPQYIPVPNVAELAERLKRWNTHLAKERITPAEWGDCVFSACRTYPLRLDLAMMLVTSIPPELQQSLRDAVELRLFPAYRAVPSNTVWQTPAQREEATERETSWDRAWAKLFRQALATTPADGEK